MEKPKERVRKPPVRLRKRERDVEIERERDVERDRESVRQGEI